MTELRRLLLRTDDDVDEPEVLDADDLVELAVVALTDDTGTSGPTRPSSPIWPSTPEDLQPLPSVLEPWLAQLLQGYCPVAGGDSERAGKSGAGGHAPLGGLSNREGS
ncbi:MAG: hypothetical protein L0Y66_12310 [Myxococcaceae bacterium]|nr:hypothetical protein [Myxococcaceae bacterium]MCI0673082.1 hypothetical protein [Myxococcaceae bacterium]